ncbi:MAG: tetratricopeptide repeat protein [Acidobacteria bacterium]|nr:tetratricopeptide repeat protein [Acidobacteriota bacterium]
MKRKIHLKKSHVFAGLGIYVALMLVCGVLISACQKRNNGSIAHAVEAWDAGDYQTAADEYERFLQVYPTGEKALEARFQLANVYYLNLHKYEAARLHYREFLNQAPSHTNAPAARERLAEVLNELGRTYEAIAEYENLNPRDDQERRRLRLRIADLYYDQKNYSQALTEYLKVNENAEYDELSEQALLREASIYHITRNQYKEAIPLYQKLVAESSDAKVQRRALYGIADCYAELLELEQAIQTLRQIRDETEQSYITKRIAELESRKREAAQARNAAQQR